MSDGREKMACKQTNERNNNILTIRGGRGKRKKHRRTPKTLARFNANEFVYNNDDDDDDLCVWNLFCGAQQRKMALTKGNNS